MRHNESLAPFPEIDRPIALTHGDEAGRKGGAGKKPAPALAASDFLETLGIVDAQLAQARAENDLMVVMQKRRCRSRDIQDAPLLTFKHDVLSDEVVVGDAQHGLPVRADGNAAIGLDGGVANVLARLRVENKACSLGWLIGQIV